MCDSIYMCNKMTRAWANQCSRWSSFTSLQSRRMHYWKMEALEYAGEATPENFSFFLKHLQDEHSTWQSKPFHSCILCLDTVGWTPVVQRCACCPDAKADFEMPFRVPRTARHLIGSFSSSLEASNANSRDIRPIYVLSSLQAFRWCWTNCNCYQLSSCRNSRIYF